MQCILLHTQHLISAEKDGLVIGLAKKFIRVFPQDVMEKPKGMFWLTHYINISPVTQGKPLQHQLANSSTSNPRVSHPQPLCSFWLLRNWLLIIKVWKGMAHTAYRA